MTANSKFHENQVSWISKICETVENWFCSDKWYLVIMGSHAVLVSLEQTYHHRNKKYTHFVAESNTKIELATKNILNY